MKKKFLSVLVAIIAALAVACFAAAAAEKTDDIAKNTATPMDATETDATSTDATSTDATGTDAPSTDATGTDATETDATSTDARRLGDVDGDDKIEPADARLALRASVHLEAYAEDSDEFFAADINANGVIEPEDARKILLASVDLFDLNDPLATPTDAQPDEEEEPTATPTDATPTDATQTDATPTSHFESWGRIAVHVPDGLDFSAGMLPDHEFSTEARLTDPNDAHRFFSLCDLHRDELTQDLARIKEENAANGLRDVASFTVTSKSGIVTRWEGVAYETEAGELTYWLYRSISGYDYVYEYIQATICGFALESVETQTVLGTVYLTAK